MLNGYQRGQRERRRKERMMKKGNDMKEVKMARRLKKQAKAKVIPLPKAWQPETLAPDMERLKERIAKNKAERERRTHQHLTVKDFAQIERELIAMGITIMRLLALVRDRS